MTSSADILRSRYVTISLLCFVNFHPFPKRFFFKFHSYNGMTVTSLSKYYMVNLSQNNAELQQEKKKKQWQ